MRHIPTHVMLALPLALALGVGPAFAQAVDYLSDTRTRAAAPAPETPAGDEPVKAERTPGTVLDDTAITTKVTTQLVADSTTKARHINVDTRGAVVTLSGKVDTAEEKIRAVEIARGTRGVKGVDDRLTVGR